MDAEDETWWLYRLRGPPDGSALDANAKVTLQISVTENARHLFVQSV